MTHTEGNQRAVEQQGVAGDSGGGDLSYRTPAPQHTHLRAWTLLSSGSSPVSCLGLLQFPDSSPITTGHKK